MSSGLLNPREEEFFQNCLQHCREIVNFATKGGNVAPEDSDDIGDVLLVLLQDMRRSSEPPNFDSRVKSFLWRRLYCVSIDGIRRRYAHRRFESFAREEFFPSAIDMPLRDEEMQELHKGIAEIPDELDRRILWRRFFDDISPKDIAAEMGISMQTVYRRVGDAVQFLKTYLKQ